MTSKEALKETKQIILDNAKKGFIKDYVILDNNLNIIEKDLEILEILKEFLQAADTGTGWIEININPDHDILDSKEHKKKQKMIRKWLHEE